MLEISSLVFKQLFSVSLVYNTCLKKIPPDLNFLLTKFLHLIILTDTGLDFPHVKLHDLLWLQACCGGRV